MGWIEPTEITYEDPDDGDQLSLTQSYDGSHLKVISTDATDGSQVQVNIRTEDIPRLSAYLRSVEEKGV